MRPGGMGKALRMSAVMIRAERLRMASVVLMSAAMALLSAISLVARVAYVNEAMGISLWMGVGDALPWLFLGDSKGLRIEWLAPWVVVLFASLPSAFGEREVLYVYLGERRWSWAARCISVVVQALVALVCLALLEMLWLLVFGARSEALPVLMTDPAGGMLSPDAAEGDVVRFMVLLVLGAVVLALVQLAIGEFAGRAGALLVCVALLVMVASVPDLPLPFSCLMASRVAGLAFSVKGAAGVVPPGFDVVLLALVGIAGVVAGDWISRWRDLLVMTQAGAS